MTDTLEVRKGSPSVELTRDEFRERFRARFIDPMFEALGSEIDRLEDVAWTAYREHRKAPRTRKAGAGFADPRYDLSLDWLATRDALKRAEHLHRQLRDRARPRDRGRRSQRAHVSRRAEQDPAPRRRGVRRAAPRWRPRRPARSVGDHRRVRPGDLSVQGLRVDGDAAVSLALLVLSEPRARSGRRLDGRDLSALGRGARRRDRHAGRTGIKRRRR